MTARECEQALTELLVRTFLDEPGLVPANSTLVKREDGAVTCWYLEPKACAVEFGMCTG